MKKEKLNEAGEKLKSRKRGPTRGDKLLAADQKKRDRQAIGMDFKGSRVYDDSIPPHWQPNIGHLGPRRLKGDSDSKRKVKSSRKPRENVQKELPRYVTKTMIRNVKRHEPHLGRAAILRALA